MTDEEKRNREVTRLMSILEIGNKSKPPEYDGTAYHYTSPHAIDSILFHRNSEGNAFIQLRASRFDCLNDTSEGTVADKVYDKVCWEMHKSGQISGKMFAHCMAAKEKNELIFFYFTTNPLSIQNWYTPTNKFVTSFSKSNDSLSMWKYYSKGNGYEGINLGLQMSRTLNCLRKKWGPEAAFIKVSPVVYSSNEQEALIREAILSMQNECQEELTKGISLSGDRLVNWLASLLRDWRLIFKSQYFEHEEEVRIIIDIPEKQPKSEMLVPIQYRYNNGLWIPYIELTLDFDILESITLGPSNLEKEQREKQRSIVIDMLKSKGYDTTKVAHSEIPVRY